VSLLTLTLLATDRPHPEGGRFVEQWFYNEVSQNYPAQLVWHGQESFILSVPATFYGVDYQTPYDLHAASVLWLVGSLFAPLGIDVLWQNSALDHGHHRNTQDLEELMDSPQAAVWLITEVRPAFQARYTGRTF